MQVETFDPRDPLRDAADGDARGGRTAPSCRVESRAIPSPSCAATGASS